MHVRKESRWEIVRRKSCTAHRLIWGAATRECGLGVLTTTQLHLLSSTIQLATTFATQQHICLSSGVLLQMLLIILTSL